MAARAQASGRGATGLSRLAPAPFQQLPLFSRVDGAALEERLGKHNNLYIAQQRDNLFNALRQTDGIHAERVETILQALVLENNACEADMCPTRCHLYMGFGDVPPLERHQVAAFAKQLREAAYAVWPHLTDPDSRQMLDWITYDWAIYQKSCQSLGTRAALYRLRPASTPMVDTHTNTSAVTTTTTTDTTTLTATAPITTTITEEDPHLPWEAMEDIPALMARVRLRDRLLAALTRGDTAAASALLEQIPPGVGHLSKYFPSALAAGDYEAALHTAMMVHEEAPTTLNKSLCGFVSVAQARSESVSRVAKVQKGMTEQELDRLYAPETRQLCLVLRNIPEGDVHLYAKDLATLIPRALQNPSFEVDLCRQPYANLKVVQLKCRLLESHLDKNTVDRLREHARNAHVQQLKNTQQLRQRLLEPSLLASDIATLALSEYARVMTTMTIDNVSKGAARMEVNALARGIGRVCAHYEKNPILSKIEMAALRWVRDRIEYTEMHA